jgi:SAM-dependent methyltransferase
MKKDSQTGRIRVFQKFINLFPKRLRLRFNPRRYFIENFVIINSEKTKNNMKVLDAGAGPCPYKPYFKHCSYESTDFKRVNKDLDFLSNLEKIPKKNETYDVILCTEVLEHVKDPEKVLKEFHRILKKHGKLLLTCPQGWRMHQIPHNYFYFTKYGLLELLKKTGFNKEEITPMGGYFLFLADTLKTDYVLEQYKKNWFVYWLIQAFQYPLFQIVFPFISFYLDHLDKEKLHTIGYTVVARRAD